MFIYLSVLTVLELLVTARICFCLFVHLFILIRVILDFA